MILDSSFYRKELGFSLKRFDSFVLFRALIGASGLNYATSCEEIATALVRAGLSTRRGAKFTARVVRVCLSELEAAGLVALDSKNGGFVVRLLCAPSSSKTETETETVLEEPFKSDLIIDVPEPAQDAYDAENQPRATGSDSVSKLEATSRINKNINTQEKKINKSAREARALRENTKYRNTEEYSGGDSIDVAVGSVDVSDEDGAALRRKLVEIVWEPTLRADLLDRAVAAVKLGFIRSCELLNCARRALEISKRTSQKIWRSFTLDVKRAFDEAGFSWTPTRAGSEPAPRLTVRPRAVPAIREDEEEYDFIRDAQGRLILRAAC